MRHDGFFRSDALERQTIATDRLDMLGPRVDDRHVEPVMREVSAGIAADRAGPDNDDALIHLLPLSVMGCHCERSEALARRMTPARLLRRCAPRNDKICRRDK